MSADLRERLREAVPREDVHVPAARDVWRRGRRQRRRRQTLTAAATVAVLALGVIVGWQLLEGEPGVFVDPKKPDSGAIREGWTTLPPAPIHGRGLHAAVWTGGEFVVWGGQGAPPWGQDDSEPLNDGAAYDASTAQWRKLAPAPLSARWRPAAVWTGEHVLIWGGKAQPGTDIGAAETTGDAGRAGEVYPTDGALYDPATDSWTRMAPFPLAGRQGASTAWTGREFVVWGGVVAPSYRDWTTLADGAAYDPATDTWRTLAESPLRSRAGATAIWTGEELVVWGGAREIVPDDPETEPAIQLANGAAYDPATDSWRMIADGPTSPRPPEGDPFHALAAAWTGEDMVVWFGKEGARYDPTANRWEALPAWPAVLRQRVPRAAATSDGLVAWGGQVEVDGDEPISAWGYAYSVDEGWTKLPESPLMAREYHSLTPADGAVIVWGGLVVHHGPENWRSDFAKTNTGAIYKPGVGPGEPPRQEPTPEQRSPA